MCTDIITINEEALASLPDLSAGSHDDPAAGEMCVMEAAAYLVGEPWSDHPACVSPVIAAFLRTWNDLMSNAERQQLKALIPVVIGTSGSADAEQRRAYRCIDWACREIAPLALDAQHLTESADALRRLAPIVDAQTARDARITADAAVAAAKAAKAANAATIISYAAVYAASNPAYANAANAANAAYAANAAANAGWSIWSSAQRNDIWSRCAALVRELANIS